MAAIPNHFSPGQNDEEYADPGGAGGGEVAGGEGEGGRGEAARVEE